MEYGVYLKGQIKTSKKGLDAITQMYSITVTAK
jgi:hypothetical protein